MSVKTYVSVRAEFDEEGRMLPRSLTWEDGQVYPIDRVLSMRPAPALKAGGMGDRYTVRIGERETFLFFERDPEGGCGTPGRWFVERKDGNG